MDKIAVCALFKDEAPYLLEWLAFHRMIGVDLFVLYDNGSSDGGADLVRASSFGRNVSIIDWPDRPGQLRRTIISASSMARVLAGRRSSTSTSSSCRPPAPPFATS